MVQIAQASLVPGAPPLREITEREREGRISRRRFLLNAGGQALTLAAMGGCRSCPRVRPRRGEARVAIVGGGLAGLTSAYELRRCGIESTVFESSSRIGGRVFTARDITAPGLTTELGGEFIDSTHEDLLELTRQFGLELIDTGTPDEASLADTYFFSGRARGDEEILEALVPVVARMREDFAALPATVDFQTRSPKALELDNRSLDEYLDRIGATGFLRDLLAVAYVTEYGLDLGEQSSLNLLMLFGLGNPAEGTTGKPKFEPYGDSDERFKVRGGNEHIIEELVSRIGDQVQTDYRLESMAHTGGGYSLSFARPGGGSAEVRADVVLLALPFSVLRDVELRLDLPQLKHKAIQELGYGQGAKLLLSFQRRTWREQRRSGSFFTDAGPQSGWDNSRGQPGTGGGLTIFTGGTKSAELASNSAFVAAHGCLPAVVQIFPDADRAFSGPAGKFHWPSHPYTKGSYAVYRRGQWTSIAGIEALPVGHVFFAGEHCSRDFQGFMNGAVQSARRAAIAIRQTCRMR